MEEWLAIMAPSMYCKWKDGKEMYVDKVSKHGVYVVDISDQDRYPPPNHHPFPAPPKVS